MSYLSVNKFAEKVGVSIQAIYQRIKWAEPEFMKFVTKEDSSTKISKDAVILFKNVNVDTKFVNVDIEQMQNEISKLLEIQEKHLKQIETLYTQLSDKDKLMKKDIIIKITYHVDLVKKTQAISVSCLCFFRKYVIIF